MGLAGPCDRRRAEWPSGGRAGGTSPSPDGRRQVFGYFGNINPWKGVPSLLKAAQRLIATGHEDFELRLHGGAPFQAKEFVESIDALIEETDPHVVRLGPYRREEIPLSSRPSTGSSFPRSGGRTRLW